MDPVDASLPFRHILCLCCKNKILIPHLFNQNLSNLDEFINMTLCVARSSPVARRPSLIANRQHNNFRLWFFHKHTLSSCLN